MLNNLAEGKMSCDMIYNFRQLIEHELCVARKGGIFEGEKFFHPYPVTAVNLMAVVH